MTSINFKAIEPDFAEKGTGFYCATIGDEPLHAGITNAAWAHLARSSSLAEENIDHPAHQAAQGFIQKKFDATGCDRSGSVVVTLLDVRDIIAGR